MSRRWSRGREHTPHTVLKPRENGKLPGLASLSAPQAAEVAVRRHQKIGVTKRTLGALAHTQWRLCDSLCRLVNSTHVPGSGRRLEALATPTQQEQGVPFPGTAGSSRQGARQVPRGVTEHLWGPEGHICTLEGSCLAQRSVASQARAWL